MFLGKLVFLIKKAALGPLIHVVSHILSLKRVCNAGLEKMSEEQKLATIRYFIEERIYHLL